MSSGIYASKRQFRVAADIRRRRRRSETVAHIASVYGLSGAVVEAIIEARSIEGAAKLLAENAVQNVKTLNTKDVIRRL